MVQMILWSILMSHFYFTNVPIFIFYIHFSGVAGPRWSVGWLSRSRIEMFHNYDFQFQGNFENSYIFFLSPVLDDIYKIIREEVVGGAINWDCTWKTKNRYLFSNFKGNNNWIITIHLELGLGVGLGSKLHVGTGSIVPTWIHHWLSLSSRRWI